MEQGEVVPDLFELLKSAQKDKSLRERAERSMRENAYNYPPGFFTRRYSVRLDGGMEAAPW